jgi:hypothetical protein
MINAGSTTTSEEALKQIADESQRHNKQAIPCLQQYELKTHPDTENARLGGGEVHPS